MTAGLVLGRTKSGELQRRLEAQENPAAVPWGDSLDAMKYPVI
jgi:hypothetical protein